MVEISCRRRLLGLSLLFCFCVTTTFAAKRSYVVYLGGHSSTTTDAVTEESVTNSHHEFLGTFLGGKAKAKESIFYSYTNHINGFAANLEDDEVSELSKHPGVVSVFPNRGYELHTTRSWEFLGLEQAGQVPNDSLWKKGNYGEDVIIGHLDSGVWPESASFRDDGLGPVPARWKGVCQNSTDVNGVKCNRKLIGARYFDKGYNAANGGPDKHSYTSPRDHVGHGTHTSSTAAGNFVSNASIFGLAKGMAKGGSPKARVATYKVCWTPIPDGQCFDTDILAAFDAAIGDGVDMITMSLGAEPADYFSDAIAIGSFHAVSRGIPVVSSAGNNGPQAGTVSNVAPWIMTVAASTMDRKFASDVRLGNNKTLQGRSLSASFLPEKSYPIVTGASVRRDEWTDLDRANLCFENSLDPNKTKGKIVVCNASGSDDDIAKGRTVKEAGGVGMILLNDRSIGESSLLHLLSSSHLNANQSVELLAYIDSTKSPVAYIRPSTTLVNVKDNAKAMAQFSSSGPNSINKEILKPDVTAPGVRILASYNPKKHLTRYDFDDRTWNFTLMSGTSMACPHVAGIVALLKNAHPDWSPAAIKSALMTTASDSNIRMLTNRGEYESTATPFNYGSGHVQPNLAVDPGLVYDMNASDYMNFLCAIHYEQDRILSVVGRPFSCPRKVPKVVDLNYPSITIPDLKKKATISRVLKNVGKPGEYKVTVRSPPGMVVTVKPQALKFENMGEEKEFTVTVEESDEKKLTEQDNVFGSLDWSDGVHSVRSPIVVRFAQQDRSL